MWRKRGLMDSFNQYTILRVRVRVRVRVLNPISNRYPLFILFVS
jgi:hypothetical protein